MIASLGGDPSITALGNCTANAAYGLLMTEPYHRAGWTFTEDDCVRGYHAETLLDDSQIPGHWPTQDTGSSGPWSMTMLQKRGLIHDWVHTRSLHAALRMLMSGPISVGAPWFRSMFEPQPDGTLVLDEESGVAGGHQWAARSLDVAGRRVRLTNSWGSAWGVAGEAWLGWDELAFLLYLGGEVVRPVS